MCNNTSPNKGDTSPNTKVNIVNCNCLVIQSGLKTKIGPNAADLSVIGLLFKVNSTVYTSYLNFSLNICLEFLFFISNLYSYKALETKDYILC